MQQNDQFESAVQIPMMKQPLLTMIKNDKHNRVEVHLRGHFESPQECSHELTELHQLAEMYPTALVYIASAGGQIDMLMELAGSLQRFENLITVSLSDACSAGFMLWCLGHVRVVAPNAEMMIHRETSGYANKTDLVLERFEFLKRRFESIFEEMCGAVLDADEMEKARWSEVWFLGKDLIERGKAISWDQFHMNDTMPREVIEIVDVNGQSYLSKEGLLIPVSIQIEENAAYSIFDVMYGVTDPVSLIENDTEEEPEEKCDVDPEEKCDVELSVPEYQFNNWESTNTHKYGVLRSLLRRVFGKGNFRVSSGGSVSISYIDVDGKLQPLVRSGSSLLLHDVVGAILELDFSPYHDRLFEWLAENQPEVTE